MSSFRIGHGYDIHRLVPGRPLVLGGVKFDTDYGLDGHSDADALTHAICDALLGAAGLPDIGHFFPNTDPAFKNINSQLLLQRVIASLRERGWKPVNIDASLIAEKPKIYPRLAEMKTALSKSIGRALAIAAHAVCLIEKT
jgi:2-C-methyl-D-erythritol 2,4-cyclodiphosphate synthase